MIDICVTHFGNKYSTKYLDNLEKGIAKNYSGDFNFIVKTDCPNRHWDKISFFDNDKRTVIMDIDMIVIGDLDHIIDSKTWFGAFPRWWRDNKSINGGFYVFDPCEETLLLKEKFYSHPELWISEYSRKTGTKWMGEQLFVDESLPTIERLNGSALGVYINDVKHNGQRAKQAEYNRMYFDRHNCAQMIGGTIFNNQISMVHFIYDQVIEQHDAWIQSLWNGT